MLGRYQTQEYSIPVAGRTLRILGPKHPHALNDEPGYRQRFDADGYKPTWGQPWPAAVMLAEHVIGSLPLAGEKGTGSGKKGTGTSPQRLGASPLFPALELGAGLGIAGLALTLAGYRVIITDCDEDALAFIRASAALNGLTPHDVRLLDWRRPPAEQFPLILGSDIIFEQRSHPVLAELLVKCLTPDGQAFFSDQNRTAADGFPRALEAAGLTWEVVPAGAKAIPAFDAIDGSVFNGRVFRVGTRAATARAAKGL